MNRSYISFLTNSFDLKSIFGNNDPVCSAGFSKKMNATLKNEYLRAAFELQKQADEYVSSVVSSRLDYDFIDASGCG